MDWTRAFDNYCERTDLTYWSEPVNAITNLAFIIAALIMWRRTDGLWEGRILAAILFAIGVGSYLFHTHATVWAVTIDVLPILLFTLFFLYLANRDFVGMPWWGAALGAGAFIPYAAASVPLFNMLPFFAISGGYWPIAALFFLYALYLRGRLPTIARNLVITGGILTVSLTFRSFDEIVCPTFPLGTHFAWHILNAILLGWAIETWRRHKLAA